MARLYLRAARIGVEVCARYVGAGLMSEAPADRDISAVNLSQRLAILTDSTELKVTNMFDREGDECEPEDAVSFVATDGKLWWVGRMADFETQRSQ